MRRDKWERQKAEQTAEARALRNQLERDFEEVFGSEAGMRVLRYLFAVCGVFRRSDISDNSFSRKQEGMRDVGLIIWDYAPGAVLQVQIADFEQTKRERLEYERELGE